MEPRRSQTEISGRAEQSLRCGPAVALSARALRSSEKQVGEVHTNGIGGSEVWVRSQIIGGSERNQV